MKKLEPVDSYDDNEKGKRFSFSMNREDGKHIALTSALTLTAAFEGSNTLRELFFRCRCSLLLWGWGAPFSICGNWALWWVIDVCLVFYDDYYSLIGMV